MKRQQDQIIRITDLFRSPAWEERLQEEQRGSREIINGLKTLKAENKRLKSQGELSNAREYIRTKKFNEALRSAMKASELDETYHAPWALAGYIHRNLDQLDDAVSANLAHCG